MVNNKIFKIDMDNTVADLAMSMVKCYNLDHKDNITDYYSDYWFTHCNKADRSYFENLLNSQGLFTNIFPMVDEIKFIKELYHNENKIIFVTKPHKTNPFCKYEKLEWLDKYFDDIEYDVVFTEDKHLIIGDYLIDDDLKYITHPQEKALTICYGNYGWNKNYTGIRANTIEELRKILYK